VELDAETATVEAGRCLAELLRAPIARVLVRSRIVRRLGERGDDGLGCREVGIADPEADHVDPRSLLLGDLPLELCEQVRGDLVEPTGELHSSNSGASSIRQISSAGPVRTARPSASSTWRSPPTRWTVTGLSHQPLATPAAA